MQRIYVDFSRGLSAKRIEVGFADSWQLQNAHLQEGERVILYDSTLEVEGILHQEIAQEKPYWYADGDWATQKNYEDAADVVQSASL